VKRRVSAFRMMFVAFVLVAVTAQPAAAYTLIPFSYKIDATTTLKKLNQTVTVPTGTFTGSINVELETLTGTIKLPPAKIKMKLAGIVPLVTATVKINQTKPVTGTIDLETSYPYQVVATATFNIRIVTAYAGTVPVNLVGDTCMTSTPVSVTMSGGARFGQASTFSGTYTIPPLKTCGALTLALNQVIPGPGNTFTAVATPA
jgi:hypothetical protein